MPPMIWVFALSSEENGGIECILWASSKYQWGTLLLKRVFGVKSVARYQRNQGKAEACDGGWIAYPRRKQNSVILG